MSVSENISVITDNIPQLDGNISIESQSDISLVSDIECNCCEDQPEYEDNQETQKIPVHVSLYD